MPRAAEWWAGHHPPLRQLGLAIVVTSLILVPYTIGEKLGWGPHVPAAAAKPTPPSPGTSSSGYFGIILYPPPVKKQLIAPLQPGAAIKPGSLTRPLLVPFDGPYWYFKSAVGQPGPSAHIARGRPTDHGINIRSTDWQPLRMEAHQRLSRAINLADCGEIDLAITNADTRPGAIDVMLVLADSSVPSRPRQVLSSQPVLSSLLEPMPQDREPVKEVLRFAVPQGAHLRRFNDLTVTFLTAPRHATTGAKVAVESFELIPRR